MPAGAGCCCCLCPTSNCPDCTSCKADPKGNAYESTATACEGKADCAVTVCYEPHQPPSSALQPCVGTSPVPKDPAFGCGKSYEVTYTCDSGWGTSLIIALLVVSALYVGGGSAYNVKAKGATPVRALAAAPIMHSIRLHAPR
jgi:hypothetical protein